MTDTFTKRGPLRSIGTAAALVLLAGPTLAVEQKDSEVQVRTCPEVWAQVVTKVREKAAKSQKLDRPFVFMDNDRNIYDCLNYGLDPQKLRIIEIVLRDLKRYQDAETAENEHLRPGLCSLSWTNLAGLHLISLTLPYDPELLGSERCQKSMNNSLKREL